MNKELRERLNTLEGKLGVGNQIICVKKYLDETIEEAREKLERWRAGESESDVWAQPSSADEEIVIFVREFGRKSDGTEVSGEEYGKKLKQDVAH